MFDPVGSRVKQFHAPLLSSVRNRDYVQVEAVKLKK